MKQIGFYKIHTLPCLTTSKPVPFN